MLHAISSVVSNLQLTEDCWQLVVESPEIASQAKPGQFVNVRIRESNDPLFRRPFSIVSRGALDKGTGDLQIVYRVVGRGTRLMTGISKGDFLDIIGPLGHGFEQPRDRKNHILIAGGMGAAGLFMLAEDLSESLKTGGGKLFVLLGAQTKRQLVLEKEFRKLNAAIMVATDDGSCGYHGCVTGMLEEFLARDNPRDCSIYACGPEPMFKALSVVACRHHIPAQVCMERHMLCGIGACLVCVCGVNKKAVLKHRDVESSHMQFLQDKESGYALVCRDGPVFYLDEVVSSL